MSENQEQQWAAKEKQLLDKIAELELYSVQQTQNNEAQISTLKEKLQAATNECEIYKIKSQTLETELQEKLNAQPTPGQVNEVERIKKISEEMLTKAKGLIFDKTKMCKNQELQIEALGAQITSLKEVLDITRDLLNIRNMEVSHLQEKIDSMDSKIKSERERQDLIHKKLENMIKMNAELKEEYQSQLRLFNVLKVKYHEHDVLQQNNQHQD